MRKILTLLALLSLTIAATAQTLNITVGSVTYQFPASLAGDMTFTDGTTLTILNKSFTLSEVSSMSIDNSTPTDNTVTVNYGSSPTVTIVGSAAQYVTVNINGTQVAINQTNSDTDNAGEITYSLTGSASGSYPAGLFYLIGSYKSSVDFNGVTLTNTAGPAVCINNGKRIEISSKSGTTNTLTGLGTSSYKGCLYIKGHSEFKGTGTLNINCSDYHGIKSNEYMTLKNCTLTVNMTGSSSNLKDAIHVSEFFQQTSGVITATGTAYSDDAIQVELDGTTSTGELTDHDGEDSGNIYIEGGSLTATAVNAATKALKGDGDIKISGGTVNVTASGTAAWDTTDAELKSASGINASGNLTVSGGTVTAKATGAGGKGLSVDGTLTISSGSVSATTSGAIAYVSSSSNTTIRTTTSSSTTERLNDSYKTSPKAIKADGAMTISGGTLYAKASYHEALETKSTLDVTGGVVYAYSLDDAINSASTMTLSGGFVGAYSTGNDAIDSNGNLYIKGATVFAYTTKSSPEVAIDANTEGGYKLYVQSGTVYAYPSLENGSSLTQSCYKASLSNSNWYSFTQSGTAFAFKVPASGTWIVSGGSSLYSVSKSGGTTIFDGYGATSATVTNGSSVTWSSYTGGSTGGGGGGPGGRF